MSPNNVRTKLVYDSKRGARPFIYSIPREGKSRDKIDEGGLQVAKDVLIRDARQVDATLDGFGFQLVDFETALRTEDFYEDREKIVDDYYKEIEECVKKFTGAEFVKCFNHQVRNKTRNSQKENNEKDTSIIDYAYRIHCDTTPENAVFYFAQALQDQDPRCAHGRFLFLNAWRNITDEPIENHPLAVLDHTSLTPGIGSEDYIGGDFYGYDPERDANFHVSNFHLNEKNSTRHAWYYFPRMKKDEVLLFKQWDSDPERPARIGFHTCFDNPLATPTSPPRQSIEVRAIAFFPDHAPDTCPSAWKVRWVGAKVRAVEILGRLGRGRTNAGLLLLGLGVLIGASAWGWSALRKR